MRDPDFLIIGAQKAGTTWIADMMRQHPEVYIPEQKEIHFFNRKDRLDKGIEWYRRNFRVNDEVAVGEATPNYLWTTDRDSGNGVKDIPGLIKSYYPDVKLIVSLRNPVDRAISAYRHHIRAGRLSPSKTIVDALGDHGIYDIGLYDVHLKKWMEYFNRSLFKVVVFEDDILRDPKKTISSIYNFIGVDKSFVPNGVRGKRNQSVGFVWEVVAYHLPWVSRIAKAVIPKEARRYIPFKSIGRGRVISDDERVIIENMYKESVGALSDLIDRDLKSIWNLG